MKIYGIGSDIISNIRIKKILKNKKFLKRIFSTEEIKKGSKLKNKLCIFNYIHFYLLLVLSPASVRGVASTTTSKLDSFTT